MVVGEAKILEDLLCTMPPVIIAARTVKSRLNLLVVNLFIAVTVLRKIKMMVQKNMVEKEAIESLKAEILEKGILMKEILKCIDFHSHIKKTVGELRLFDETKQLLCLKNGIFLRLGVLPKKDNHDIDSFTIDAISIDGDAVSLKQITATNTPLHNLMEDAEGNILFTTVDGEVQETRGVHSPEQKDTTFTPHGTVSIWKITQEDIANLLK